MSPAGDIVILTSVVEPEDEMFVSTCIELGTSSCGDTIQEAFENLEEAIAVHLNALEELGETGRCLSISMRNLKIVHQYHCQAAATKLSPVSSTSSLGDPNKPSAVLNDAFRKDGC